jgi:hypothetical protein
MVRAAMLVTAWNLRAVSAGGSPPNQTIRVIGTFRPCLSTARTSISCFSIFFGEGSGCR